MTATAPDRAEAERAWLAEVGMRVRLGRVRLRLSQDAFAPRAGVSRVTLGSIERGDHAAVVTMYRRIASALGVRLGDLLDGAR